MYRFVFLLSISMATALNAGGTGVSPATPSAAPAVEVRAFPPRIFAHAAEVSRGLQTALVHNFAVINRGAEVTTLLALDLEVRAGEEVLQHHSITGPRLQRLVERSGALAASGQIEQLAFQFHPDVLVGTSKVVGTADLTSDQALVFGQRSLLLQDRSAGTLVVRATLRRHDDSTTVAEARIELLHGPAATVGFPLRGRWFVAAGASWHTHHRWAVAEEFALDLARLGEDTSSHRGNGSRVEDYFAWNAEVAAVADGQVVAVVDRYADIAPLPQHPGETGEAYLGRVMAAQAQLLSQGFEAIPGNLVVVDHGAGVFSHYAHLRSGSVVVERGQRVRRGQLLGHLGNSGNTTEPHLHFQLADGPDPLRSVGLPVAFDDLEVLWAEGPRPLQSGDVVATR